MKKIIILLVLLLVAGCSAHVTNVNYETAKKIIDEENAIIIDVRTQEEFDSGHIDGALLIPVDVIDEKIEENVADKKTSIIVYCRSGNRSKTAADILINHGYENVYDLGSINNWKE